MTEIGEYSLKKVQRFWITYVLHYFKGNRTKTAEALGISIRGLRNKIKEYGLK